jgi:mono/diheme cytochrome c family protein
MRRTLLVLAAAGALAAVAGCGGSSGGSSGGGGPEAQFASLGCASCHTLAAADAKGDRGPDLDELKPTAAAVEKQVTDGGGGMPSYQSRLSAEEIRALAEYVARSAAGG